MADRVVNNGIKFAYVSKNPVQEIKKELEKYFLYQNILIIDHFFEFGRTMEKLRTNIKCNFIVVRDILECKNLDNIACIVLVNNYDAENIKFIAYKSQIPYMFVLTTLCESSIFKNSTYHKNFEITQCNFPLGIVFCEDYIYNSKNFQCSSVIEISSISFNILQKKLGNLFFSEKIEYENFTTEKKLLIELQKLFEDRTFGDEILTNKLARQYLSYVILTSKDNLNILDNLVYLYKNRSNVHNLIEIKYAYLLILTSLEKNYFTYYTRSFKDTIDIERHIKYLKSFNIDAKFSIKNINENKVNFLLDEFREKIVDYVQTEIGVQKFIKNVVAELDIDFLFNLFSKLQNLSLTNYISLEPNLFKYPNFLSIMFESGLLNYEF